MTDTGSAAPGESQERPQPSPTFLEAAEPFGQPLEAAAAKRRRGFGGRLLSLLLAATAVIFLALMIRRNWTELRTHRWTIDPLEVAGSVVALAGVLAWGVWVWSRVLRRFGDAIPLPSLLRIWFVSNLARYIPGKVWQFVGVAQMARGAGLSASLLLTSMVVHVLFSILSATTVSATLYPYQDLGMAPLRWVVPPVALLVAILLVHPAILNTGLRLAGRVGRREVASWSGRWIDGIRILMLSLVSWILYGAAFWLFVDSLVPIGVDALPALVAVNALSFLAGYLSLLPAGFGVREAAIALLLAPFVPAGLAPVMAILSRLWLVGAELVGAAAVASVRRSTPTDRL